MSLLENGRNLFNENFGRKGDIETFFAPGRVNIIGEHIDYNGGSVLPAAISLGIYGFMRKRNDSLIRIRSAQIKGETILNLTEKIVNDPARGWGNYPAGIASALIGKGIEIGGMDILFSGNLPEGSGLSSSAALEVLTGFMMSGKDVMDENALIDLALMAKSVENNFIGVNCGIMDQFAVAMGREGHAILLDTETLAYEHIPLNLGDYTLVIMNSNKKRELAESAYNTRLKECREALSIIKKHRNIENLVQGEIADIEYIQDKTIMKRARHVITENQRVNESIGLLISGDIAGFGKYLNNSHFSLRDDYEVTGFELDSLVDSAHAAPGVCGARMTGAGFGGCAIAIVERDQLEKFISYVFGKYKKTTGIDGEFFTADISGGVRRI